MEPPSWPISGGGLAPGTLLQGSVAARARPSSERRSLGAPAAFASGWSNHVASVPGAVAVLAAAGRAARQAPRHARQRHRRSQEHRFRVTRTASVLDDLVDELGAAGEYRDYSDEELLDQDVLAPEPAPAGRDEEEIKQLFLEGAGGGGSLSFEALAQISEIAGMVGDGDLSMEELGQMWAEAPKVGDAVDIDGFRVVLARIDDLFEPVDEEASGKFMVDVGDSISDLTRKTVRKAMRDGEWKLFLEYHLTAPQVRPPEYLPGGVPNPLCSLGECGGKDCSLHRLRSGCEQVRPDFQDFCVQQIKERCDTSEGLVYLSMSCGHLYFDWELLERLVHVEGIKIREIWLVEHFGVMFTENRKAQAVFTDWFADTGITVRAFQDEDILKEWVQVLPSGDQADVVIECDTFDFAEEEVLQAAMRPGALHFILTQDKSWSGFTPVRQLIQRGVENPDNFQTVEWKTYQDGKWADKEVYVT
eukprot:CAMPEP_0175231176 /NCGR_PEP_ID=MMETSP0093-20121207/25324_1 /TAXON_ID=311494 /ORGANISM="Alexandrium monilatum, Strain CCMP3105" /LENGTH=474 /DNA_ID=CAMNT_0016525025 /DNA_START=39 /DNA_END=1463 /DNA_ORIENTATION=-